MQITKRSEILTQTRYRWSLEQMSAGGDWTKLIGYPNGAKETELEDSLAYYESQGLTVRIVDEWN